MKNSLNCKFKKRFISFLSYSTILWQILIFSLSTEGDRESPVFPFLTHKRWNLAHSSKKRGLYVSSTWLQTAKFGSTIPLVSLRYSKPIFHISEHKLHNLADFVHVCTLAFKIQHTDYHLVLLMLYLLKLFVGTLVTAGRTKYLQSIKPTYSFSSVAHP